jgi:hypothetical protein
MTLAQKIVEGLVFSVTKILVIEDHKLHDIFLHVAFESQSLLEPTSDQTALTGFVTRMQHGEICHEACGLQ